MKEKYIEYARSIFKDKALDLVLEQIEMFYDDNIKVNYTKYKKGDDVLLKKGTFIHGIFGDLEGFDWIVENGFIGSDFSSNKTNNKIKHSIGMWNIKEDILLKDYINNYSGFTVTYTIGRGPGSKEISELIPYHKFDEVTERLNNRNDVWMYFGDQTKEVRFLPSLVSDKVQIAFILNMDTNLDKDTLREFLDYRYYETFLDERFNRNASTTDRESAIIFGLPSKLIEGVFVGRKIEKNIEKLNYIKSKLPNCYICNLDGKVILL